MDDVKFAVLTNAGGRQANEDAVLVKETLTRLAAIAADGLGGHGGGKIASRAAVGAVADCFDQGECRTREGMARIFYRAHKAVLSCQTEECQMKTTLACLFMENRRAWWAHVGDSRIYHFQGRKLVSRTLDHSVSQLAVAMGRITEGQIRFHVDRNKLLRALGSDSFEPELAGPVSLDEDFHAFLICTDGFWEYVLEEEMEKVLEVSAEPGQWLEGMKKILARKAPKNDDNYTAAAVFSDMRSD